MTALLIPAFLLGLMSSFHCVAMCGPIALAVPSRRHSPAGKMLDTLLLNSGRLLTYAALGGLFGIFGRGLHLAGLQQSVSLLMGLLVLAALVWPTVMGRHKLTGQIAVWTSGAQRIMAKGLARTSPAGLFTTGMLNGLLPCGLVYIALAAALLHDGPLQSAAFMVAFGLGTWPSLVALRLGVHSVSAGKRALFRRLQPWLVAGVGILFVVRGLGLGIPYISPVLGEVAVGVQTCHGAGGS
ncbi:MAG: sulfite exporter TauE/SafE family protein [Flavobacteriales bacterium]|jgi:sulfite exporter TauE/SafE|nr:sulfite exporter TauE/SafE family protein [Flavobacteriales bacterium]